MTGYKCINLHIWHAYNFREIQILERCPLLLTKSMNYFLNVHFQWKCYNNYMFHFQSVAVQHIYLWMEFFILRLSIDTHVLHSSHDVVMTKRWRTSFYECEKVLQNQSLYIVNLIRPENNVWHFLYRLIEQRKFACFDVIAVVCREHEWNFSPVAVFLTD